jgi:hypothetical protein
LLDKEKETVSLERNTMLGQALLVKLGKGLQRGNILWYTLLWAPFLFVSIALVPGVAADLHSYAIIRDDATLKIERRIVRLFGVYIPDIDRMCIQGSSLMRCERLTHAAARAGPGG